MAAPAQSTIMTPAAAAGPGEVVPVAFLGRTSTLEMQEPGRLAAPEIRSSRTWLPTGWFIVAYYWDVESGGLDLEQRSQGQAWQAFTDAGIPRDGGMADLLTEAARPAPGFTAVICENIERSGRDTFNALKLEKKLSRQGIPVFATDEPIVIDGVNATTVLVRRVKQGVAEWFRLQLKEKTWKGPGRACPGRVEHRPGPLRVHRRPHPAPGPGQSQPGPHQDPPGPGPGPRPGRGADLHLAGRGQARHADHRRPAERRPGPVPRPRPAAGGPPRPSTPSWATRSTPGTWSTAGSAPATAAASPSPR